MTLAETHSRGVGEGVPLGPVPKAAVAEHFPISASRDEPELARGCEPLRDRLSRFEIAEAVRLERLVLDALARGGTVS